MLQEWAPLIFGKHLPSTLFVSSLYFNKSTSTAGPVLTLSSTWWLHSGVYDQIQNQDLLCQRSSEYWKVEKHLRQWRWTCSQLALEVHTWVVLYQARNLNQECHILGSFLTNYMVNTRICICNEVEEIWRRCLFSWLALALGLMH